MQVNKQEEQVFVEMANVHRCRGAECGGLQTGEGGQLSSPRYPDVYPSPSRCAWLLEAPAGHTITVRLRPFHTLSSYDEPGQQAFSKLLQEESHK